MNDHDTAKSPAKLSLFAGIGFLILGVFFIAQGLSRHEMSIIFMGAAYIFLAMGNLPFTRRRPEGKPTWRSHATTVSVWVGLALAVIAVLLIASGPNLATWLGLNANVTPSDLVHHPTVYNNQKIRTSGYVSATDGWCRLEVGAEVAPPTGSNPDPATAIFLGTNNSDLCKAPGIQHTWANVSGTFEAMKITKNWDKPYVLSRAQIVPTNKTAKGDGR